ncbi:MAG: D-aminoacylase [Ignavibacteriales bacterium]|nr:D-aminoacylase [Ignavibacteriales bacterium]
MKPGLFILLLLSFAALSCQTSPEGPYDLIIQNGKIIDGTGNPWYQADIGIYRDRITAIGKLDPKLAKRVIDAAGKIVAPGFIDALGQSEHVILVDNRAMSKISQGVTTEINGEGESAAPLNDKVLKELKPSLDKYNLTADWTDFNGYFARVEKNKTAINLASYVGAAQVREYVIGFENREPTVPEMDQMRQLVREAMQQGALGVSSALEYTPAMYAKTPELIELAKAAAEFGGIYVTHIRNEQEKIVEAVLEAADIGRAAKIPVEIWHLKTAEKPNWGKMSEIVHMIQDHRNKGLDMTADVYPYIAFGNSLSAPLPGWVQEGGTLKLLERLKDPMVRKQVRKELEASGKSRGMDFQLMMISYVANPVLKQWEGKRFTEVAAAWKKDPIEAMFDFIIADSARSSRVVFAMTEEDLRMAMGQPWVSFCSDASARALDGPLFEGRPHPRAYGSFPRILALYVRESKVLSLEDAIRKMTSLPAQRVGIKDRGILKQGFYADLVMFDPETVTDKATFENPHQYSEGMSLVVVNGKPVWENGKFTGNLPGRVLRGPGYAR